MAKKEMTPLDELDAEEIELLEAAEKNELITLHENLDKYVQVAKNTVATNKRISITIEEKDFRRIRAKSIDAGISYQTLINRLLHQFTEGKIDLPL
ncbi:MAG TPA: hypothetical protein PLO75_07500 [Thermotogota bacterium]|nr:hypothetical protein [Thermotogota bacterium]